ncbi:SCPEP1 isoform 4, partial [Pan troglodytes]
MELALRRSPVPRWLLLLPLLLGLNAGSMGLCDGPQGCLHVLVALLCHQLLQELLRTAPGHVASGRSRRFQ